MKEFSVFLLVLGVAVVLYFGFIQFIGKTMKSSTATDSISSDALQLEQKRQAEETRDRQKQLMIERQSRMRDIQRR